MFAVVASIKGLSATLKDNNLDKNIYDMKPQTRFASVCVNKPLRGPLALLLSEPSFWIASQKKKKKR